jgi:hypothetical protein
LHPLHVIPPKSYMWSHQTSDKEVTLYFNPSTKTKSLASAFSFAKLKRQRTTLQAGATTRTLQHPYNDGSVSPTQKMIDSMIDRVQKLSTAPTNAPVADDDAQTEQALKPPTVDVSSRLAATACHSGVNVISVDTAAKLISKDLLFDQVFDEVHVIDCRFEYEFNGKFPAP